MINKNFIIQVTDLDTGLNSKIQFRFVDRETGQTVDNNRFEIDAETGDVISTASFLGQAGAAFRLMVEARDRDGEGLASKKTLLVSEDKIVNKRLLEILMIYILEPGNKR